MATITKAIMLDDTGKRIASALEIANARESGTTPILNTKSAVLEKYEEGEAGNYLNTANITGEILTTMMKAIKIEYAGQDSHIYIDGEMVAWDCFKELDFVGTQYYFLHGSNKYLFNKINISDEIVEFACLDYEDNTIENRFVVCTKGDDENTVASITYVSMATKADVKVVSDGLATTNSNLATTKESLSDIGLYVDNNGILIDTWESED